MDGVVEDRRKQVVKLLPSELRPRKDRLKVLRERLKTGLSLNFPNNPQKLLLPFRVWCNIDVVSHLLINLYLARILNLFI